MPGSLDDVGVEPAGSGDIDAIRGLVREAYSIYVERIGREPAPMQADYERIVHSGRVLLAKRADEVIGLLVTDLESEMLLVENLAVGPSAQGSGVGSLLLREAERLASSAGRTRVRLYTNEAMVENVAFYLSRGFHETHRGVSDGFRRVYFEKTLQEPARPS